MGLIFALLVAVVISCDLPDGDRERVTANAVASLLKKGYQVKNGTLSFKSHCTEHMPACFGENPSSPYGMFDFGERYLDLPVWQLEPTEALVFYGCTPPKSKYFSFQIFVFISHYKMIFAAPGDPLNHLFINTSQPATAPFDATTLVTTSADQNTVAAVNAAFAAAGAPSGVSNTQPIFDPSALDIDPLGEGLGHSVFMHLYRVAACEDKARCKAYENFDWPVLRVSRPGASPDPFPLAPLRKRGTGTNELHLNSTFAKLIESVMAASATASTLRASAPLIPIRLNGRECMKQNTSCLGADQDAVYFDGDEALDGPLGVTPQGFSFPLQAVPSDFAYVCGVQHDTTNKTTYMNVAAYNPKKAMGVGARLGSALLGSADIFLKGNPLAEHFYCLKVARECGSLPHCLEIPVKFPGVPLGDNITIVERAYLEPATGVGPLWSELLHPVVLYYSKT